MKLGQYIAKRLVLMSLTLLGITIVNFALMNAMPGGPIETRLHQIRFGAHRPLSAHAQVIITDDVIQAIKRQNGFDKPLLTRYTLWLKRLAHFDFGESYLYARPVAAVVRDALPVSLQFGAATLIFSYGLAMGFGTLMARTRDRWLGRLMHLTLVAISSVPTFVFAVLLLVFLAGGGLLSIFPLGYLRSESYEQLSLLGKIGDRLSHFALPLTTYLLGSVSVLSFLFRDSFLNEMHKDYIRTARALGMSETKIYLKHALRNALIPLITGLGGSWAAFLGGSLLIETIFQLNGIGQLGYSALVARDYNVIMALAVLQSLVLLGGNLVSDIAYVFADPRLDFE